MFCSLDVIFIEKKFFGTAYAGLVKDANGKPVGAQMGIRQSVLDEDLGLTQWSSWKEQLSFGGIVDSYTVSSHLPIIQTSTPAENLNDFLYFVVAHEIGHIFDYANLINETKNCPEVPDDQEPLECELQEGSWGSIGWLTTQKPKAENDSLNRSQLCFYWCDGNTLGASTISNLYADLFKTNFISIYSTTQPWDDFADSLAYFLMKRNLDTAYSIHTNQGQSYDIMKKLNSPVWRTKRQYLEKFISRTDIIYP